VGTRKQRLNADFLMEFAREWNAHVAAGWPPIRAMAVSREATEAAVVSWASECREQGFSLESAVGLRHHHPAWALRLGPVVVGKERGVMTEEELKAVIKAAPPEDAAQHHDRVDEADPAFQESVHHLAELCSACGQPVPELPLEEC
jgi:hypothetical protein